MKHLLIIIALVLFFFGVIACERADRAIEAVGKAKDLKTELEKTAKEVQKDITAKSEALLEKAKKTTEGLAPPPERGDKNPDRKKGSHGEKSTNEHGTEKE